MVATWFPAQQPTVALAMAIGPIQNLPWPLVALGPWLGGFADIAVSVWLGKLRDKHVDNRVKDMGGMFTKSSQKMVTIFRRGATLITAWRADAMSDAMSHMACWRMTRLEPLGCANTH